MIITKFKRRNAIRKQKNPTKTKTKQTPEELGIYCVQLIFLVNMHGLFLQGKRGISVINAFQNILGSSNRKPNKIWVDQGGGFYSYLFKGFLKNNKTEMYST